jgi:hypothetical protein
MTLLAAETMKETTSCIGKYEKKEQNSLYRYREFLPYDVVRHNPSKVQDREQEMTVTA